MNDRNAPDWTGALCTQTDPELWFPEKGQNGTTAKKICNRCPLQDACRQYGIDQDFEHGIYGGLGAEGRRLLKANRRRGAAA